MTETAILQAAANLLGDDLDSVHPEYVRAITDMLGDLVPVPTTVLDKGSEVAPAFMLGMAFGSVAR